MEALLNECLEYMLTHELVAMLNEAYCLTPEENPEKKPLEETPEEKPDEKPDEKPLEKEPDEKPIIKETKKYTVFYPNMDDSLFWCMYVHEHGLGAYETQRVLKKNMVNTMMTVKRQMFDHFNKDTQQTLKHTNHKITNAILNEIKCDLMTRSLSSIQNLIACCVYWKCTIVLELGAGVYATFACKDYVEDLQEDEDANTVLLYVVKVGKQDATERTFNKNKFKFAMETDKERIIEKLHTMRASWYKIDHYQKPIKAISNYNVNDLLVIYEKVCVTGDVLKMKKQDIYYEIVVKLGILTVKQFI